MMTSKTVRTSVAAQMFAVCVVTSFTAAFFATIVAIFIAAFLTTGTALSDDVGSVLKVPALTADPQTGKKLPTVFNWKPEETAIVICDMWNQHWCKGATARVAEMAPAMNNVLKKAREKGVTIFHAPSSCMAAYTDHPARKRALEIPTDRAVLEVLGGENWSSGLATEKDKKFPVDHNDGGCDCNPHCPGGGPWKSQIATLTIDPEKDFITDSGVAIGSYLKQHGIKNVIVMGVHTNMCVIGRPFGLRQQVRLGNNVVLMRDLTDTMYNHESWPNVPHFKGTDLVVEYIEKYVCPSITSTAITGAKPFVFAGNESSTADAVKE